MNLSAWAFIFGACGALFKISMLSAVKSQRADTELPAQHGNLMAQGEQLYVPGPVGTGAK